MSMPTQVPEIENIIEIGRPEAIKLTNAGAQAVQEIHKRISGVLPDVASRNITTTYNETADGGLVEALWPLQNSFGDVQIRGSKEAGLYIFDGKNKTMTGSPVRAVLEAGQDTNGDIYVFIYGNVLGGNQNDDRYAWMRTKDGALLPGTINDEPVRIFPEGLVRLSA